MSARVPFMGHPLDRADNIRSDPDALSALHREARLLRLEGLLPRLDDTGRLAWGVLAEAPDDAELVFLGLLEGKAAFAVVPTDGDPDAAYARERTWSAFGLLSDEELALYGGARSLLDWHARHRFCTRCGGPTVLAKGGWQRTCASEACAAPHFPRVDPVTIMLVEHDGRLLLGRQPRFPPRRFSALAGFVEPGESIEEAVAREVLEEAGVHVRDVSYIASQPWPFPSQLMIGCHAHAESDRIVMDETELEQVRWFSREEVAEALEREQDSTSFVPPPSQAIANHMLRWWMEK